MASRNRKNNLIMKINDGQGSWSDQPSRIEEIFVSYFQQLFSSSRVETGKECGTEVDRKLSTRMVANMEKPWSKEEVEVALSQLNPSKAPGPDGMTTCFYQKYWPDIGNEVTQCILSFMNGNGTIDALNETNIVLIPKINSPSTPMDYRPINLCNVLYKIVSKMMTNKLKVILPNLISDTQSAFVPGRLIFDNALVAYETMHSTKNKKGGRDYQMAIKLDMSKAYDRVEWDYLEEIMGKMGFPSRWISLVMKCVRSVRYAVLINGKQ